MIFVGSLLAIVIILYAIAYFKTEGRINKEYAVSLQPVVVPADSASYIAGKHVAENRGCIGCHGADLSVAARFLMNNPRLAFYIQPILQGARVVLILLIRIG